MEKFDFGDALKKAGDVTKKVAEKATAAAQVGAEKAKAGAKTLKDATTKEANKLSETVKAAAEQTKVGIAEKNAEKKAATEKAAIEATGVMAIAPQNAVKVFYYLMASDKKVTPDEEEKFNLIGQAMDLSFAEHKEALVRECEEQMEKTIDAEDYHDVIRDGVEKALSGEQQSRNGFVTSNLLLWDLLTIAYGDGEYGEEERKLLKYVVRKLNIARDIFLEMESSILAVSDIEKEINWIKGTDRPYLAIEKQVKELEKRRNDILFAVKALIML